MAAERTSGGPLEASLHTAGDGGRVLAVANRTEQQHLTRWRQTVQFPNERLRHVTSRKFTAGPECNAKHVVIGFQLFQKQWYAGRLASQDRPTRGSGANLPGHVRRTDGIVEPDSRFPLVLGHESLSTDQASVGRSSTYRSGTTGQRLMQRFDGLGSGDLPQSHQCLGSDLWVSIADQSGQSAHRVGIATHADRVDHANQELSLEFIQGLAQGVVDARVRNPLQAEPCVGAEPLVGQQDGQCRHRFRGTDEGQSLASFSLVKRRGVRLQHRNELRDFGIFRCSILYRRQVVLAPHAG